jgi:digeranylgeranylglycerophospholipid reductase
MYAVEQIDKWYDLIVVGAGPAGSMAAWQAAQRGIKVLLLEKDREVGTPVRCAEGVARKELERLVGHPAPSRWVATEIRNFRLFAPDGTPVYVNIDETGYVLNRKIFDYDLALQAVTAGARLATSAEVVNVIKTNGAVQGVHVKFSDHLLEVKSPIVIAADGVESRVARWAGIDSTIKLGDMETCVQYTLGGIKIDPDTCDFYFSRDFAPGGYAWVFPKGENTANVGLGISGYFSRYKNPEDYLNIFLQRYFSKASILAKTVGGVPVDRTMKEIVSDGFMIVGDAAHQANPISGGGIVSAMVAGQLAGEVAAKAVLMKKTGKKDLMPYAREWQKKVGKSHLRYYRLKEALMKFDDRHFNSIAREFVSLAAEKQNLLNLFKIAFKTNPAFLLDVIKLFSSR